MQVASKNNQDWKVQNHKHILSIMLKLIKGIFENLNSNFPIQPFLKSSVFVHQQLLNCFKQLSKVPNCRLTYLTHLFLTHLSLKKLHRKNIVYMRYAYRQSSFQPKIYQIHKHIVPVTKKAKNRYACRKKKPISQGIVSKDRMT